MTAGGAAGVARFPEVRRASALRACLPGGPGSSGLARSQRPVGGARSKGLRDGAGRVVWLGSPKSPSPRIKGGAGAGGGWGGGRQGAAFQEAFGARRAGELRKLGGVKAGVSCRARREEASAACPWRAVGDSQDGAAPTPRAVGRPVGSKEPEEASRRVWDCGLRGGREEMGIGGEILAWPVPPGEGVCVRGCAGQHAPGGGRALGGSESGWKGSRVGDPKRGRASERDQGHRGLRVPLCVSQALWLRTGAAWHPQECGFSRLPRPPPVPQGGGRQEKGGGGRNLLSPTRASNKG